MKKLQMTLLGLLLAVVAVAQTVRVNLVDSKGNTLPFYRYGESLRLGFSASYQGNTLQFDSDGYYVMDNLLSGPGTYVLDLADDFNLMQGQQPGKACLTWDGKTQRISAVVEDLYCFVVQLEDLTQEDAAYMHRHNIYTSVSITNTGRTKHYDKLYFQGDNRNYLYLNHKECGNVLLWSSCDIDGSSYHIEGLFGEAEGKIDLREVDGVLYINPKKGKHLLSIGKVLGRDGNPLYYFTLNDKDYVAFEAGDWRRYCYPREEVPFRFSNINDCFSWEETIEMKDQDYCLNVDLRDAYPVTFQVKDRDGSPLSGAYIYRQNNDGSVGELIASTDADGSCIFYNYKSKKLSFVVDGNKKFYGKRFYSYMGKNAPQTFEVGYKGDRLATALIKGGKDLLSRFGQNNSFKSWGWIQNHPYYGNSNTSRKSSSLDFVDYEVCDYNAIRVGCLFSPSMFKNKQAYLVINPDNKEFAMLPMVGSGQPATGDIYEEFDLTNMQPVTFVAPTGYYFNGQLKVNDVVSSAALYDEYHRPNRSRLQVHMNPGQYKWSARMYEYEYNGTIYPYPKAQDFTVDYVPKIVYCQLNENSRYGMTMKVLDENAEPFAKVKAALFAINESGRSRQLVWETKTNEVGEATLYTDGPGKYLYEVSDSGALYQCDTVEIGEERLFKTISYQNHIVANVDVDLRGKYSCEAYFRQLFWNKQPFMVDNQGDFVTSDIVRNDLKAIWQEDGAYDLSTKTLVTPGYLEGRFIMRSTDEETVCLPLNFHVDRDNHNIYVDVDKLYRVSLKAVYDEMVEDPNELKRSGVLLRISNSLGELVWDSNLYNGEVEILLAPGKYTARFYYLGGMGSLFWGVKQDVIPFEVVDKNIAVHSKLTNVGMHDVSFRMLNTGYNVDCEYALFTSIDKTDLTNWFKWRRAWKTKTFGKGLYDYVIYLLMKNGVNYATCITGQADLNGQDKVIDVDLAGYHFFKLVLHLKEGSPAWYPTHGTISILGQNLNGELVTGIPNRDEYWALKDGSYVLKYTDSYNGEVMYAEFKVDENCPEEIHVTFSHEVPTGVESLVGDEGLKVELEDCQLRVVAAASAPVQVEIVNMAGSCVKRQMVKNGAVVRLGDLLRGVYVVRLQQGMKVVSQKFIF